jgi:hypothetical protein
MWSALTHFSQVKCVEDETGGVVVKVGGGVVIEVARELLPPLPLYLRHPIAPDARFCTQYVPALHYRTGILIESSHK